MRCFSLFIGILPLLSSVAVAKDKVHLQWSICGSNPWDILYQLGEDGKEPFKHNPITYFDTECPVYTKQGLMFRRKVNKGTEISSVKIRFEEEESDVPDVATCVWDRYGDQTFYTCERRELLNGTRIWSEEQARFVEQYRDIAWDDLVPFGPYWNTKWKVKIDGHKAVFDDVVVGPDHLMEIEMKVDREQGESIYKMVTEHLKEMGDFICARQDSRTLRAFRALGYAVDGDGSPRTHREQPMVGGRRTRQWPLQATN